MNHVQVNLTTLAEAAEPASSSASSNNKNSGGSSSRSRYRGRFSEVRNPGEQIRRLGSNILLNKISVTLIPSIWQCVECPARRPRCSSGGPPSRPPWPSTASCITSAPSTSPTTHGESRSSRYSKSNEEIESCVHQRPSSSSPRNYARECRGSASRPSSTNRRSSRRCGRTTSTPSSGSSR